MSWFFDFTKLLQCTTIRHEQLRKEKMIDEILRKCECKDIVQEYLFSYRDMNRRMSDELYNNDTLFDTIINRPYLINEQLDIIGKHILKIETMTDVCNELPEIIKDMK